MAGVFGSIDSPITGYGNVDTGLPSFVSNVITVIFAAAGLYAFFNLMIAGFTYITAGGDEKKIQAAMYSINMSLLGLIIMVGAAAVTGVVSFLLFNNAGAILTPSITGPGSL
ncbi:MAG: hypothetical protein DPW11_02470 [bacterium]|nr:hypothetical protein [Candidatus Microgenomates bacterium CPR3]MCQ3944616.1 hypothetical protein [bacterium]RIK52224.1 MAG: hypothetical protein DCC61_00345 [Candidatus Microgenomates bacterium]